MVLLTMVLVLMLIGSPFLICALFDECIHQRRETPTDLLPELLQNLRCISASDGLVLFVDDLSGRLGGGVALEYYKLGTYRE